MSFGHLLFSLHFCRPFGRLFVAYLTHICCLFVTLFVALLDTFLIPFLSPFCHLLYSIYTDWFILLNTQHIDGLKQGIMVLCVCVCVCVIRWVTWRCRTAWTVTPVSLCCGLEARRNASRCRRPQPASRGPGWRPSPRCWTHRTTSCQVRTSWQTQIIILRVRQHYGMDPYRDRPFS